MSTETVTATEIEAEHSFKENLHVFNFYRALKRAQENPRGLIHYYQLPLGWRENKYIIEGYRFSAKHSKMWKSVFAWHNESINIWSHLIGLAIMIYIAFVHYPNSVVYQNGGKWDVLVIYAFLVASMTCLASSSIWHTYSSFAHYPSRCNFACIDYTGITILITCSIIAVEYVALYHHANLVHIYIPFSTLLGIAGFFFNWSSHFDKPECRSLRIWFFVGLSFSGVTAMLCKAYYEGFLNALKFFMPLSYKSFIWYGLGVVFYGGLIPERWRYDIIIENNANFQGSQHHYSIVDVIDDNVARAGDEEIEVLIEEYAEKEDHGHNDCASEVRKRAEKAEMRNLNNVSTSSDNNNNGEDDDDKFKNLISKHFKEEPIRTPYANNFMSLWWVDYFLASHNIWHICVLLGILGHYVVILDMFSEVLL
ncbi:IZH3 [Candida oxycetoniae]|uniref:IZH3 n=1 Tax=Candida oxycetoniae TaxID=497107 RepID=A0AAI9SY78_9ASCO|nr:IZH3 [Candida oxycetoniae]KAI3404962.2 IZH3 [Candida oxycetoniae]